MLGSPIPYLVALNVVGVNLIAPVLPAYATHFGVGFAAVSTLIAAFAAARMSLRIAAGSLADRHGSRFVCAGGGAVQMCGALLAIVAPGFGVLLAARAVQGMGSALFGTSVNRYLLIATDKGDLGRATAGYQGGIVIGSTIGPLLGGLVAERFGIFAPFYVQAALAAALVIASLNVVTEVQPVATAPKAERPPGLRALLTIGGFRLIMFAGFGLFVVRAGVTNLLVPAFSDDVLGLSPGAIGAVISFGSAMSLIVMPLAGRIADTTGRWPVAIVGMAGSAVTVALYSFATDLATIVVVTAGAGLVAGLGAVALPTMMGDIIPPGTEGRASGVYRMSADLGWVFGPLLLGALADRGNYTSAFNLTALLLLVAAAFLWRSPVLRDGRFAPDR